MSAGARRIARWLTAEPGVVVVLGERDGGRGVDRVPLTTGLQRWRVRIARVRALALARRWLIVALLLAALLCLLGSGVAVVVAVPCVLSLIACGALLRRRPSLSAVARLLDDRLALSERLATALELTAPAPRAGRTERSLSSSGSNPSVLVGVGDSLATRVVAEAEHALAWSLDARRARLRRAPREWGAVVVAAGVVAVVALVLSGAETSSQSQPGVSAQRRGAASGAGAAAGDRRSQARRPRPTGGGVPSSANPYSSNPFASAYSRRLLKRLQGQPTISYTSPGLKPDVNDAGAAPLRNSAGGAGQRQQSGASNGTRNANGPDVTSPAAGGGARAGAITPVTKPPSPGSPTPSGAASTPGGGGGASTTTPGNTTRSRGRSGNAPSPSGGAQRSASSPSSATGGSPTGGTEAGHQRGTTQRAPTAPQQQTAGSVGLPLQGEFAPGRPGGGAARPGQQGSGGGGRSRTQQVAGAGAAAGGSFPYIPSAATPLGRGQQTLLLDYLRELSLLAGRP
ncbi:hypothetical protein [Conexibacter sp. CPCC 206217]|uniref:hypothetical protein n=1 Tax=Conexibacter sp. CPCC 206217 TaxID=3064574 RepID=UPI00271E64F3|nr:hypothetical protein [Conexibacter sp. CPCC 206217]MDO8210595.1 hypothetical protein [Conexibacter sp. CPCC 206217]